MSARGIRRPTRAARAAVALATLILVAACAQAPARVERVPVPERVEVPIPVPCLDPRAAPQRPATPTREELLAMDRYRRTLALWGAYARLEAYATEAAVAIEGCTRPPGAQPP